MCKHDVILLDSLTNLNSISKERVFIIALPLNLQDTEGASCRVIALEEK
jgi:kynurenine formamidase